MLFFIIVVVAMTCMAIYAMRKTKKTTLPTTHHDSPFDATPMVDHTPPVMTTLEEPEVHPTPNTDKKPKKKPTAPKKPKVTKLKKEI